MSKLRDAITDAEGELQNVRDQYLRKNGWKHVCDVPGSVWLWQKALPDGRTAAVPMPTAIMMQDGWPSISSKSSIVAPITNLWFVRGDPNHEGDTDLLVYANDHDQAILFWRMYFELDLVSAPEYVGKVPAFEKNGAVSWADIMKPDTIVK